MVELLAAGMIGANYAAEASSYLDAEGAPSGTGQLLIAFDPSAFGNHAVGRFGGLAVAIESQQGARLPGERRLALRAKAKTEGVTITDKLLEEIEAA
jgi:(2R)-3-sulfolactate dehydrogenase (NADP+)